MDLPQQDHQHPWPAHPQAELLLAPQNVHDPASLVSVVLLLLVQVQAMQAVMMTAATWRVGGPLQLRESCRCCV
jgi:hypothetical protein